MSNPIFQALNGGKASFAQGRRNLAPALLRHIQGFQGNPVQQIQQKLQNGEMSQNQYNQLRGAAEQIAQKMMGYFE